MPLGSGGHVFGAVVAELHRMPGLHRKQRRVAADDGREVFLAAEGSAGLGLDNATLFSREIEYQRERVDEVERTLHRAADGYTFGRGILCDDAIVLDVELLLRSCPVLAFDDEVGVLPD